jgi:hypothetical protein
MPLTIRHREAGETGIDAADDLSGLFDLVEGRARLRRGREAKRDGDRPER